MRPVDFDTEVAARRGELEAHCYRMLGSVQDAEDAVQETLVRAWSALDRLEDGSNVRAWLYRIATNRCLTLIEGRRGRALPVDLTPGGPLEDVAWLEPYATGTSPADIAPDARYAAGESMRLAFVALLQHLPGRQRAALLLRDVLGFPAADAARVLDTSVPALNSALQRARATIEGRVPPTDAPDDEVARLATLYALAWEQGDVDAIVALLGEHAHYSMPPLPRWFAGRDDIRAFLLAGPLRQRWRFLPTRANDQAAFGTYALDGSRAVYVAVALDLVRVRGGAITEVVSFLTPDVFGRFGLPDEIPYEISAATDESAARPGL